MSICTKFEKRETYFMKKKKTWEDDISPMLNMTIKDTKFVEKESNSGEYMYSHGLIMYISKLCYITYIRN